MGNPEYFDLICLVHKHWNLLADFYARGVANGFGRQEAEAIRALSGSGILGRRLDIAEDRRRLDAFKQTRAAVPLEEVKTWVASWGSAKELPRSAQNWMILLSPDAVEDVERLRSAPSLTMGLLSKLPRCFSMPVFRLAGVAFGQADLQQLPVIRCGRTDDRGKCGR
jgi:hypothetical protein